jgi:Tfp pilus assembly protein PilN
VISKLNLSSRPFRNRSLPWILAAMLLFVGVCSWLFLWTMYRENSVKTELVKSDIARIEPELEAIEKRKKEVTQSLTAEQQNFLIAGHRLVANKRFVWSRLFADLESVLPSSVSVTKVSVGNVFQSQDRMAADLEFAVLSRDYQSVLDMIAAMGNSGKFQAELRQQNLQRGERGDWTEYTMALRYTPSFGVSTNETEPTQRVAIDNNSSREVTR